MHFIACTLLTLATVASAEDPPAAEPVEEPTPAADTEPELDPALVTWYQDMRLACSDKRTSLVARHHGSTSSEPGALVGHSVWADMARSGLVSWQAASDPRVNDKTLARTPEPADFRPLDTRTSDPSPQLYPALPAELTGRLQAIELAQGETDAAWRAWQDDPGEPQREALVAGLEELQRLCTGME